MLLEISHDVAFLTHNSPKIFGVKSSLKEIRRIFPIKLRNFLAVKNAKIIKCRVARGLIFFKK